jgi:hypothetical protein
MSQDQLCVPVPTFTPFALHLIQQGQIERSIKAESINLFIGKQARHTRPSRQQSAGSQHDSEDPHPVWSAALEVSRDSA